MANISLEIRVIRAAIMGIIAFSVVLSPVTAAEAGRFEHRSLHLNSLLSKTAAASLVWIFLAIASDGNAVAETARIDRPAKRAGEGYAQAVHSRAGDQAGRVQAIRAEPSVLGSVALPFRALPMADRWRTILADNPVELITKGCRSSEGICAASLTGRLSTTVNIAAKLPLRARLQLINSAVNTAIAYRSDRRSYGKIDHWATFSEVMEHGAGDCEDYAILKMWLLKAAGVPPESMQLIVLRDTRRGLYHAVLAVHDAGGIFILDNVQERVHRDTHLSEYIPIYSLGWQGTWIHGFRSRPAVVAEGPLDAIHPGEPASRPVASGKADQMIPVAAAFPAAR